MMDVYIMILVCSVMLFFICLFTCLFYVVDDNERKADIHANISVVSGLIAFFVTIVVCFASYKLEHKEWTVEKEPFSVNTIESLGNSNQINGTFYLRRGNISEDMYYQYMIITSDGGMEYKEAKANNSKLYYHEDIPRVEKYLKHREFLGLSESVTIFKFYIPDGSIDNSYSIDLNK